MDTVGDAGKIKGRKRKEVKTAGCCVCGGSEEGPVSATLNWEKGTPLYEGNGTKKKKMMPNYAPKTAGPGTPIRREVWSKSGLNFERRERNYVYFKS